MYYDIRKAKKFEKVLDLNVSNMKGKINVVNIMTIGKYDLIIFNASV